MNSDSEDSEPDAENPHLTPPELDYSHLPGQTAYRIAVADAECFSYQDIRSFPLVITNELKVLYFEMTPSGVMDWHTHSPQLDQINMCLQGRARLTQGRKDGSEQVLEFGERELVYIPAGARHKMEVVGDEEFTGLSVYQSEPVARLELFEEFGSYNVDEWPTALWVDRKRDEIVKMNEDAVST